MNVSTKRDHCFCCNLVFWCVCVCVCSRAKFNLILFYFLSLFIPFFYVNSTKYWFLSKLVSLFPMACLLFPWGVVWGCTCVYLCVCAMTTNKILSYGNVLICWGECLMSAFIWKSICTEKQTDGVTMEIQRVFKAMWRVASHREVNASISDVFIH